MKRFLSAFLALCLALAICPLSALAAAPSEKEWKLAYFDFIRQDWIDVTGSDRTDSLEDTVEYHLFDLNRDGVPELWINYGITAYGGKLCTYSGGEVHTASTNVYFLYYLPDKALFLDSGGYMDMGHDTIYRLENGQFTQVAKGVSTVVYVDGYPQFDENDDPIYEYAWNDAPVEQSVYEQKLKATFDVSQAEQLENGVTYREILSTLSTWSEPEKTEPTPLTLSLQPTELTDLAEALLTVHSGGLIAEGDAVTFHPGGLMGQAIPVTALGLLSGLTLGQATPKAPSYVVDYLGMTLDQITAIWGDDYVTGGWWYGGSLLIYYEDYRTPCSFFISDPTLRGFPEGDEPIQFLFCGADTPIPIAKGINANSTYSQLQAAGITGEFLTGDEANSGDGETAKLYYSYSPTIAMTFCWYEGNDPYTTPPGDISIYPTSTQ